MPSPTRGPCRCRVSAIDTFQAPALAEDLSQPVLAVSEDSLNVTPHETPRDPRGARDVLDIVDNASGVTGWLELMLVTSPQVGTGELSIDKAV